MSTWPFKILVKYASRGRKERFFAGLDNIFELSEFPDRLLVLISIDEDDQEMCNEGVKEKLSKYKNIFVDWGLSENKIHACNRGFDKIPDHFKDWDIVANFSDDQRWTIYGWDTLIRKDFNSVSPDFSHYMAYLDPDTNGALSTLFICGRGWYDRFGWIYDPQFKSLFCDNLQEDCAKHLGKYHYTGYSIYQHFNPSYGYERFEPDQMYIEQQKIGWTDDQTLYFEIIGKGIDNYLKQFNL
jgi:hypothetical protein